MKAFSRFRIRILAASLAALGSLLFSGCEATQVGNPDGGVSGYDNLGWGGKHKENWEGGGPFGALGNQRYR